MCVCVCVYIYIYIYIYIYNSNLVFYVLNHLLVMRLHILSPRFHGFLRSSHCVTYTSKIMRCILFYVYLSQTCISMCSLVCVCAEFTCEVKKSRSLLSLQRRLWWCNG